MENEDKQKHFVNAIHYVASHVTQGGKSNNNKYPLCRGDILVLVKLINQEMEADPSALKRLTTIREKLGDLVFDAPEMSREEAKELKEGQWA
jgi:hypothetical protein